MKTVLPMVGLVLAVGLGLGAREPTAPALASCTWTGHWTGYFQRTMAAGNNISGVEFGAVGIGSGNLDLTVDENCNAKGTVEDYTARVSWTSSLQAAGDVSHCDMAMSAVIPSGKASDTLEGPALDLDLSQVSFDWSCDPSPPSSKTNSPPTKLHLEPAGYADGTAHGDSFAFDTDNITAVLHTLAQTGAKVSITDEWELHNRTPGTAVVVPDKGYYFLENVTVQNTFTATVDWQGNSPGQVHFTLAGQSVDAPGGDQAQAQFNMGQVPVGKNELAVTAITATGSSFDAGQDEVIIVPLEPWAHDALIQNAEVVPSAPVDFVTYSGTTQVPDQPIILPYLDLAEVPIIGDALGKWGIPPFQVQVGLQATSAGDLSDPAPVSGEAKLYVGGENAGPTVNITGQTVTDMTETALLLDHGYADFKMAPYSFSHTFGAASLVPGLTTACTVPVVCEAIKGALNVANVPVSLIVDGDGHGNLAVRPDHSALYFDEGTISPALTLQAAPNLGFTAIAAVGVNASGTGKVTWEIAPDPGLKSCTITLTAGGSAWAFGQEYPVKVTSKPLPCGPTASQGETYLAVVAPTGTLDGMRDGADSGSQRGGPFEPDEGSLAVTRRAEAHPVAGRALGAGSRNRLTALAHTPPQAKASPVADLAIAASPGGGRMAFAYAPQNPGGVLLQQFDGTGWNDPIRLAPAALRAFSAQVGYDADGQAIVVWSQPNAEVDANDVEAFVGSFDLHYAVVASDGSVVATDRITQDQLPDMAPTLATDGKGHLWLAWLRSPSVNLWGTSGEPNQLLVARWSGDGWGEADQVANDLVGTLNIGLAARDAATGFVVVDVDGDADPATAADRELVAYTHTPKGWGPPVRLTDDRTLDTSPLAAYSSAGDPMVAWSRDGRVVGIEGPLASAASPSVIGDFDSPVDLAGAVMTIDPAGNVDLVFRAPTEAGQGIWLSQRAANDGRWSTPETIVEVPYGFGRYAAAPLADGSIWIGYASLTVPEAGQAFADQADLHIDRWIPDRRPGSPARGLAELTRPGDRGPRPRATPPWRF